MEPTNAEVLSKFDAHEKRDEDRFESQMAVIQTGFQNLSEKVEDMKKDHLIPLASRMDGFANRLEVQESKLSSLSGGLRFATYIGIPLLGILLGIISWQSLSIINLNTEQAALKAQSEQIDTKIKSAISDQFETYIQQVNK